MNSSKCFIHHIISALLNLHEEKVSGHRTTNIFTSIIGYSESAKRLFPLCESYLLITQFVESRSQFKTSLVNRAFAVARRALLLGCNIQLFLPPKFATTSIY